MNGVFELAQAACHVLGQSQNCFPGRDMNDVRPCFSFCSVCTFSSLIEFCQTTTSEGTSLAYTGNGVGSVTQPTWPFHFPAELGPVSRRRISLQLVE